MPGLRDYCDYLEIATAETLDQLDTLVHPDVHFKDPFNDVRGVDNMRAILADLFEHFNNLTFEIHERVGSEPNAMITWTLSGSFKGRPCAIPGASHLVFNSEGLLTAHIDYWDASSGLYEHFPVIGWLLRALRHRLQIAPIDR